MKNYVLFSIVVLGCIGAVCSSTTMEMIPWMLPNDRGDLAEKMPLNINTTKPEEIPTAGDVVEIDAYGFLKKSASDESRYVVGIVSTNPAHVLRNMIPNSVPIALSGVVPCKVIDSHGMVQPGDLLVSAAKPGYARKAGEKLIPGTVVGKALDRQVESEDTVLVLVMLR